MKSGLFLFAVAAATTSVYGHAVRLAPVVEPLNAQILSGEYIVGLREPEVTMFGDYDYESYVDGNYILRVCFFVSSYVLISILLTNEYDVACLFLFHPLTTATRLSRFSLLSLMPSHTHSS